MLALFTTLRERWDALGRPVGSILMTAVRFSMKGGAWLVYPALFIAVAFIARSGMAGLSASFVWFTIIQHLISAVLMQRRVGIMLVIPGHLRHMRWALMSIWGVSLIPIACALGGMTAVSLSASAFGLACLVLQQILPNRMRWFLLEVVLIVFLGVLIGVIVYKFPAVLEFWDAHSGPLSVTVICASALIVHCATGLKRFKEPGDAKQIPAKANAGPVNLRPKDERKIRQLFVLNSKNSSPMQRLFFGLFLLEGRWRGVRWSRAIVRIAAGLACLGLVISILPGFVRLHVYQVLIGLVLLWFLWQVVFIRSRLLRTRHEQALLVLLPGIPRGYILSRAIAARLGLGFGRRWLIGLAALELLRLIARIVAPGWFGVHFVFWPETLLVGTLPLLGLLWRSWGERSTGNAGIGLVLGVVMTAFAGVLYGLAAWPFMVIAVAYFAATAVGCACRWHAMASEPAALPVGHLARGEQQGGGGRG